MNFFQSKTSEQEIVEGIRLGGSKRQKFENKLYDNYRYLIKDATYKHKLVAEDASMAYSDAVLTVIEHLVSGRFEGRSSLKTYIHQIFFNKCVDAIRKNSTNSLLSIEDVLHPIPDQHRSALAELIMKQDHQKLRSLIHTLGERCQLLLNRWAEGYSDKENAEEFAYNTAQVAQTTRLRCLEKLKELYRK